MIKKGILLVVGLLILLAVIGFKNPLSIIFQTDATDAPAKFLTSFNPQLLSLKWTYTDNALEPQDFACFRGFTGNSRYLVDQGTGAERGSTDLAQVAYAKSFKVAFGSGFKEGLCSATSISLAPQGCWDVYILSLGEIITNMPVDLSKSTLTANGDRYNAVAWIQNDGFADDRSGLCFTHPTATPPISYEVALVGDFKTGAKLPQFITFAAEPTPSFPTDFEEAIPELIQEQSPEAIAENNLFLISDSQKSGQEQIGFFQYYWQKIKAFFNSIRG